MGKTKTSRKSSSALVDGAKSKKAKALSVSAHPTRNVDSVQQPEQELDAAQSDQIHVGGGKYISRGEAAMTNELYKHIMKFMMRGVTSTGAAVGVMQGIDSILVKYGQKPEKESKESTEEALPCSAGENDTELAVAGPSGTKAVDTGKTAAEAHGSNAGATAGDTSSP